MKRNAQGSLVTQGLVDMNRHNFHLVSSSQESVQLCTDGGVFTSASLSSEKSSDSSEQNGINFDEQIAQANTPVSQNQPINEAVSQTSSDQSANQLLFCNPLLQNFNQNDFNQQQFILQPQNITDESGVQLSSFQVVTPNGDWNGEGIPISFQDLLLLSQIQMGGDKESQNLQQQILFQQQQQDVLEQVVQEPILTDSQHFAGPAPVTEPSQLPNLPKKPLTAYLLFSTEYWNKHKENAPSGGVCEIGYKIGEEWRKLPESEKETYKEIYKKQKLIYEKDIEEYCKRHNLLPSELKNIKANRRKKNKKIKTPNQSELSVSNFVSMSGTSTVTSVGNVTNLNNITGDIVQFNRFETSINSHEPMNISTIDAHSPSTCSVTSGTSEMNSQTSHSPAVGNMSERSPSVCDQMSDGRRSLPNQLMSNIPQQAFHQEQILPDVQQQQLVFSSQMQLQQMPHHQNAFQTSNGHKQVLSFGHENVQNCEKPQSVQNQQWQSQSQIQQQSVQQQQTSTQQQVPVEEQKHFQYVFSFGSNGQPDYTLVNVPETVANCNNGQQQFLQQNNFNQYSLHNQVEQNSQQLPPISTMCFGRQGLDPIPPISTEGFEQLLKERDTIAERYKRIIIDQREVIQQLQLENLKLRNNNDFYQKYFQGQNVNYTNPHSSL